MQGGFDLTIALAHWLAWISLCLLGLMIAGLLILRWGRWRSEPKLAAFQATWWPRLFACALGDEVLIESIAGWQRWPFMKMWLHTQMSLRGPSRDRLAQFGREMGCIPLAFRHARSSHASEQMVGMLALGFLGERSAVNLLLMRLTNKDAQQCIYAARALLEIDPPTYRNLVTHSLTSNPNLDLSLASVMLKPFRAELAEAMLLNPVQPGETKALCWLRLASAFRLQIPQTVLATFFQYDENRESLTAAIRLVQGDDGAALVASKVSHPDWEVRVQVARRLGVIGRKDDHAALTQLLTDAQWWVRYRAAQALLSQPGMIPRQLIDIAQSTTDRYALSMVQAVIAEMTQRNDR